MEYAQKWFIFNRLLDDFTYHAIVRPKALALIKQNKWNAFRLNDEQTQVIEGFCLKELQPLALKIAKNYSNIEGGKKISISNIIFDLPWNRTFEAEIDFTIKK